MLMRDDPLPKGSITLELWDRGRCVSTHNGNLITNGMRRRFVRALLGTADAQRETNRVGRFALGSSGIVPSRVDVQLGKERFRKPIAPGDESESGYHYLAAINLALSDLVTPVQEVTAVTPVGAEYDLTVGDSSGFAVNDYIETNPDPLTQDDAKFGMVTDVPDGVTVRVGSMTVVPLVSDQLLGLIREAGMLLDTHLATLVGSPAPTDQTFTLNSVVGFLPGDFVLVIDGFNQDYGTIDTITDNDVVLLAPLSFTPLGGATAENGELGNHAVIDPPMRKLATQTAIGRVDFDFDG